MLINAKAAGSSCNAIPNPITLFTSEITPSGTPSVNACKHKLKNKPTGKAIV